MHMLGPISKKLTGFGATAETTKLLVKGQSTERPANMPTEFFHPNHAPDYAKIAGKILCQTIREVTHWAFEESPSLNLTCDNVLYHTFASVAGDGFSDQVIVA